MQRNENAPQAFCRAFSLFFNKFSVLEAEFVFYAEYQRYSANIGKYFGI